MQTVHRKVSDDWGGGGQRGETAPLINEGGRGGKLGGGGGYAVDCYRPAWRSAENSALACRDMDCTVREAS